MVSDTLSPFSFTNEDSTYSDLLTVEYIMENTKIVVVDDDQDIRDSLQVILESKQYTVITAANKNEGMETIKSEKPDLIMLDVMMSSAFLAIL